MIGRRVVAGVAMPLMALLLVTFGAGRAVAGTPDPCADLAGHYGQWRVAGHAPAQTTSPCVGSTRTPLCTLDTYWTGKVREIWALGHRSAAESMVEDVVSEKQYRHVIYTYRVVGCRVLTADDRPIGQYGPVSPAAERDRNFAWYPGDIALDLHSSWCRRDLRGCDRQRKESFRETYIARRVDDRHWRLVDWDMGGVFPLQGHVGEPCRPEDGGVRILTTDPATSTSRCIGSYGTPLCAEETRRAEEVHGRVFLKYKVVDCERLDSLDLISGRWDPRPVEKSWPLSHKKRETFWMSGDVRLGLRAQMCNTKNNKCDSTVEYIIFSHNFDGNWGGGYYRMSKGVGDVE